MNNIVTDLRVPLTIKHVLNLMFITLNSPIVEEFNPMPYAKLWLQKHHNADDVLRGGVKKTKQTPSQ